MIGGKTEDGRRKEGAGKRFDFIVKKMFRSGLKLV